MGQSDPLWAKIWDPCNEPKCTEIWSEKVPDLYHFGPIWPTRSQTRHSWCWTGFHECPRHQTDSFIKYQSTLRNIADIRLLNIYYHKVSAFDKIHNRKMWFIYLFNLMAVSFMQIARDTQHLFTHKISSLLLFAYLDNPAPLSVHVPELLHIW